MTSTNHFRGRELSTNLKAPVSPRRKQKRRLMLVGPVQNVAAIANLQRLSGAGCSDFHDESVVQATTIDATHWLVTLGSFSSHPMQLIVTLDQDAPLLTAMYQLDCGSGWIDMSRADAGSYNGERLYDTGQLPWTDVGAHVAGYCRILLS
jgi:hypothetical protein